MKYKVLTLALCLVFLMNMALPCMATDTQFYMTLYPENFDVPTDKDPKYTISYTRPAGNDGNGSIRDVYLQDSGWQESTPATVNIYIPKTGEYYIWGLGGDHEVGLGTRWAAIGFDGSYDSQKFGSDKPGFSWRRSSAIELEQGWHILNTYGIKATSRLIAIVVTDDDNAALFSDSTTLADIDGYTDLTAPVVTGDITAEYSNPTSMVFTFPTATDNTEIAELSYSVDGKEITPNEAGQYAAEGLTPLVPIHLEMKATDAHGNEISVKKTFSTESVAIETFEIEKTSDNLSLNLKLKSKENDITFTAGLAIYTKDFRRMVASEILENISANTTISTEKTLNLQLPQSVKDSPSDYVVGAIVWDSFTNSSPYVIGKSFEEGGLDE